MRQKGCIGCKDECFVGRLEATTAAVRFFETLDEGVDWIRQRKEACLSMVMVRVTDDD